MAGQAEAPVFYGGQAVIEGVMMRGPERLAVAVRRPDRSVTVRDEAMPPWTRRSPLFRLPVIRGAVTLCEALVTGVRALIFSTNEAAESEDEKLSEGETTLSLLVAVVVAVLLFVLLPTWALRFAEHRIASAFLLNLLEGGVRLALLVGYIAAISRVPDIRRVLEYHGAEHKVLHTWEAGEDLTVDNARRHSTLHPRCGTSFLMFLAVVGVIVFAFTGWPSLWERLAVRLAFFPLVAGIAYEAIRFSGRAARRGCPLWLSPLIWPGLQFQRLTTREPDDAQLEVAIVALRAAMGGAGRS